MNKPSRLGVTSLLVALVLFGFVAGIVVDRTGLNASSIPSDARSQFNVFIDAWNTTRAQYVDPSVTQPQPLMYGAIGGMIDSLGDVGHSRFLTPEMVLAEHQLEQGQLQGIGVEVQQKSEHIVIVAPIEGSPAQKAGLKSGDIILAVNGKTITGMSLTDVVNLILGPAGTKVTLTIGSPDGTTRDVTLVRANIVIKSVSWAMLPGTTVADVHLASFSQGTTDELKTALSAIKQQGATGIILDLRDNPGGLLDEAVSAASQFLNSGNVLLEKDRAGKTTPVPVQPGGLATHIPMAVLVNEGTASAAEIVTGALQDGHRATVIGETTFGTGTVLGEFALPDGSALLLAIQEWLTPDGRTIWHTGLVPDQTVSLPADQVPLYPDAEQGMTSTQLQQSGDTQLLAALKALTQSGQ